MKSYNIQYRKSIRPDPSIKTPYVLDEKLGKAIEVAMTLGMPLLLTGEPGTGKTKLAEKIAHDLHASNANFLEDPLRFHAKTTSTARDLFYTYDALKHFHDANIRKGLAEKDLLNASNYINLQALGKAIALTDPNQLNNKLIGENIERPYSSVVLIDEIDKAPRDFPNDILNEIEDFSFQIKELNNFQVDRNLDQEIIVVMTSNSEKNLPDAFLRRVIFHHIDFPNDEHMKAIINSHFPSLQDQPNWERNLEFLIEKFGDIRASSKKKPATAELLAWIRILEVQKLLDGKVYLYEIEEGTEDWRILQRSFAVLVKTINDLKILQENPLQV